MSPPLSSVQELGLQIPYREDRGTHAFIRKVMVLPFLETSDIRPQFKCLRQNATTGPLHEFMNYVSSTWIDSNTWPPSCWSVFLQSVRTINDVEGRHNGVNTQAQGKSQLPMYLLIDLLHKEAKLTSLNVRMVSEKKLPRVQRRRYQQIKAKVFSLWGDYADGEKTARRLLKACLSLVGPRGV